MYSVFVIQGTKPGHYVCLPLISLNNIKTILEVVLVTLFAHIFPDENTALKF